jgi:hypothetical protein
MRPLIRIVFTLFFLCLVVLVFGGTGSVRPVSAAIFHHSHIERLDSLLTGSVTIITVKKASSSSAEEASNSVGRICSCQILNLGSSNYDHRYVVLLAEKTAKGSSAAYNVAKNRIQKEKKHLKQMFYDKVEVVSEMQGAGSCKSMFLQLKTADSHLQLYEILNADIN